MKNQQIEDLKNQFDQVKLFHKTEEDKRSCAVLVKGSTAFVGISKCVSGDMFSRKRGRQIAIGRAILAYNISLGKATERTTKRTEILSFAREINPTLPILEQIFDVHT